MSNIPQDIINLNNKLNSFDYGILVNNKPVIEDVDFNKYYRSITVEEFESYKIGVCWDYVNYEAKWLKDNNYDFSTVFIMIDEGKNYPTHTFVLLHLNNKVYWFESSWTVYQGIYEYETYEDAVNDIVEKHKEFIQTQYSIDDDSYVYILEYDTEGLDNHLTDIEFMNNITEQNGLGSMFP